MANNKEQELPQGVIVRKDALRLLNYANDLMRPGKDGKYRKERLMLSLDIDGRIKVTCEDRELPPLETQYVSND